MFDAGSAVFTLTGHVVRTGFEQYGRLVDQARAQKEHSVVLGSKVDDAGFNKFAAALTGTRQKVTEFTVATKRSFDEVAGSSDRMSKVSSRGLGVVGDVVGKTAEKLGVLADTAKATADRISTSQVRIDRSVGSTAGEYKVFGDEAARAYEKAGAAAAASAREQKAASAEVLASQTRVARGYRNPLGPPGGGGGGGGGHAGDSPENQAKKTTAAWKSGFNTLAGIGKWATVGILGVGALSLKAASDFQRNMTLLHTQANYATEDVKRLSKEVLDLAPKVGVGPNELAKSLYHVASAGIAAKDAMTVVKVSAEAAKVGMANTEDVTNAVVAVWKSAPKDIHSLGEAVGVMNDIVGQGNLHWEDLSKALTTGVVAAAKNAHIGMRDLGAALDVMTSRGIPAEQAATRLRTTLTLMSSPTGKAAAALSQLGLSQSQLAQDMEKHGLSYALDDLQRHLDKTFPPGRKLTVDQERKALTDYGNTLYAAGERGKKLTNDIAKFKHGLDQSGDAAIKQSQLITSAFGGSRMGTTMALLVQNADDVRKHFDTLHRANAAGRFQKAWKETQKDFSVQVSMMWAGVQKLAIEIGDYLIPKVEAMVKALIHAWDWLHKHKIILDALVVLFGTLLVASITAFFARLVAGAVKSTIEIGKFAASIRKLPGIMADAARKSVEWLGKVWSALRRNKVAAEEANAATAEGDVGGAVPGGGGGPGGGLAEAVGGAIEGMITGVRGTTAPGSQTNPLAVIVMAADRYGLGAQGAASGAQTKTEAEGAAKQVEETGSSPVSQPTKAATEESVASAEAGTAATVSAETKASVAQASAELNQVFKKQYGELPGFITKNTGMLPPDASQELKAAYSKYDAAISAAMDEMYNTASTTAEGNKAERQGFRALVESQAACSQAYEVTAEAANATEKEIASAWDALLAATDKVAGALDELLVNIDKMPPEVQALAKQFTTLSGEVGADTKAIQAALDRLMAAADAAAAEIEGGGATLGGDLKAAGTKAATEVEAGAATAGEEEAMGGRGLPGWVGVPNKAAAEGGGAVAARTGAEEAAAGAAPLEQTGMMAGMMGMGGKALGFAGGAAMGGLVGIGMGGMAQSALGLQGGTAGTLGGAGVGAAIGMIGGPIGAMIGSSIGAAIGPTLLKFFEGPTLGEKAVSGFSKGFGGPTASELKKSVTKLIDDGKKSADGAVKAAKFEQAGQLVAQQLEAGWNQYKFQDEPTMFKQLRSEIGRLPPYAQGAAAASAIGFAQRLEKEGRLPVGAAQKMLQQVEAKFPNFEKYMGLTGYSSMKAFTDALNLKQAERNTGAALKRIAGDFPQVSAAITRTKGTVEDKSAAAVKSLLTIASQGSGPASRQAKKDLDALRATTQTDLDSMATKTEQDMSDLHKAIAHHSSQAATDAAGSFTKFYQAVEKAMSSGLTTSTKGTQQIVDVLNAGLQAFGQPPVAVSILKKAAAGAASTVQSFTSSLKGFHVARGGRLPGSEFGSGDQMTLIDPLGMPRAKMAGDEAVFNRHQMPYVDMGLRALGINGAEGLWNSVSVPHHVGLARGGSLRRLATGGYTGYSLPLPRSEMLPGSWSIDQGVDIPAPANTPEYAIGPGKIIGEGIQGFGPNTPILRITAGPLAGRAIYYGHAGPDTVRVNQTVRAGQRISEVGAGIVGLSTGPHIEIGYYPPGGMGAGSAMATTLKQLMGTSGVTSPPGGAGTGGGMAIWAPFQGPSASGSGAVSKLLNAGFQKLTDAGNAYGSAQVGAAGPGGAVAFSGNEKNTILKAAKAYGIPPYILFGVWGMETAYGSNVATSSAGAMGNFQFIPGTAQSYGYPMTNRPNNAQFAQQASSAAHYLSDLIRQHHGDWNAALTAYSGGGYGLGQVTAKGRAAGFAGGGWLPGHQTGRHITARIAGRNPWAPIPSTVGHLPGFRPPRVRRGAGGLHIVGGSRGGGARGGGSSSSRGRSGAGKQQTRPRQNLSQTTANTLKDLGFGAFVDDQNELGRLDSKYSQESDLFQLFDSGAAGLPLQDLNELMGIREKQFDILHKEWRTLPGAISAVQNDVNALMGHKAKGHWKKTGPKRSDKTWVPDKQVGGVVPKLTAEVTHVEDEIKTLRHELQLDSQKIATIHHRVSASVQNLADGYANSTAAYLNDIAVIQDKKFNNSQQRIVYQGQLRNLPSPQSSSSASLSVSQIVSGVMSGALPSTGAAGANPAKKGLQNKIASLHASDVQLSHTEQALRQQLSAVKRQKDATARAYRAAGFDAAWAVSLDKYRIDDLIYRLQLKLDKLKASLKAEQDAGQADQQALQTLQNWQTGGLQGSSSISDSLESTIYNMLDLYRQGAQLPTPGRSGPTLSKLESILGDKPPKGLGLPVPTGLTQGIQTASQAYADFTAFQASRQALFQQFGSNFVGAGGSPASNSAGLGAGLQYFGAAAGPNPGAGAFAGGGYLNDSSSPGKGGTTINITNHFAAGPPDPHTWSAGTTHELNAMV